MVMSPSPACDAMPSRVRAAMSPAPGLDPRISSHFAAAIAFAGCLVLSAFFTATGGALGRPAEVGLLVALVGAVSWWSTVPGAVAAGAQGWLFYLGFVVGSAGDLRFEDWRSLVALAGFLAVALAAAGSRSASFRLSSSKLPRSKEK